MPRAHRLSRTLLLKVTLAVAVSTLSIGYLWISKESQQLHTMAGELRSRMLEQRKTQMQREVEQAVDYIEYMRNQIERRTMDGVRYQVYQAHAMATHLYQEYRNRLPLEEIQALVREALRNIRFNNGRGYYFATRMDGVEQLFADRPDLEGKDLLSMGDTHGKPVIRDMIALCRTDGEGFYEYTWTKPGAAGDNFRKISFVKYFEPFDWLIGTGEYLDDMESEIQQEVLRRLAEIRVPGPRADGYIFVAQWDGLSLTHPASGRNMLDIQDANGVYIVRELIAAAKKGGGFVDYVMPQLKGERGLAKMSYVQGVAAWQWYVGTGSYLDDIEAAYQAALADRQRSALASLGLTVGFTGVSVLGALLLAAWSVRQTRREIATFSGFFETAKTSSSPLPPERLRYQEFRQLAEATNEMIVERSRIQNRLSTSEHRMELALTSAEIGLWDCNFQTGETHFSPTYFTMLGYQPDEFKASYENWYELLHPDDRIETQHQVQEALNSESGAWNLLFRMRHKDGSYRWINSKGKVVATDSQGNPLRATGTHVDNTAACEAKQALEVSERRYRDLFENLIDISYRTDTDGVLQMVSPSVEKCLGYRPVELIGQTARLYHRDPGRRDEFRRMLDDHGEVHNFESEIRRKDGSYAFISTNARKLWDPAGTFAGVDGIMRDVSELKRAREEAHFLEKQLLQAQKMEAIGTLAGGIAHDFNNILAAILGFGELVVSQLDSDRQEYGYVLEIVSAAERARELVKRILTFSRLSEQERAPVRPALVVGEAIKLLEASIPKTIEIRKSIDPETGTLLADATQIHQVVMNLCTNAYHAMCDHGGVLEVGLSNLRVTAGLASRVPDLRVGKYVVLSVSDNGPGMSPEVLLRAFDPFFTTKKVGEGTGMGLSVVHGIAKAHEGAIDVQTALGQGTRISVYFPLYQEVVADESMQCGGELPRGCGEHILVIDDEPAIAKLCRLMLSRLGYKATSFENPEQALQQFQEQPDEFDAVITDQTMPGLTGADVLRAIRTIRPNLPVLICTGYSDMLDEEKALSIGAAALLFKPLGRGELANAVYRALHGPGEPAPAAMKPTDDPP